MNKPMHAPTHTRYKVIFYAILLAVITYIDRVCISQAAPLMSKDLGFTKTDMSLVFAAFAWGYALFEIPAGWLGDKVGPRKVLMRIVIWWSFFTAATGWAWNRTVLMVVRFLFGAGEAGVFPVLTKAFTMWLPNQERVKAQGILWMAARWGGAFTPALVLFVLNFVDWRRAFEIFGAIGILWAIVFYYWYRDRPKDHPSVNAAELEVIGETYETVRGHSVPWARFASSRSVWLLWLSYFCVSYGWYFYITWLPTYLREARHIEPANSGILAGLPLFLGGIGCMVSGLITPRLSRMFGSSRLGRKIVAMTGVLGAAFFLFLSTMLSDPVYAVIAIGMASFANDLAMPPAWGACMDVGGQFAGTLSGSMNMMGNLAGGVAPIVIGMLIDRTGNWDLTFYISASVYLIAAACWFFLDSVTPLDKLPAEEVGVREPQPSSPRELRGQASA